MEYDIVSIHSYLSCIELGFLHLNGKDKPDFTESIDELFKLLFQSLITIIDKTVRKYKIPKNDNLTSIKEQLTKVLHESEIETGVKAFLKTEEEVMLQLLEAHNGLNIIYSNPIDFKSFEWFLEGIWTLLEYMLAVGIENAETEKELAKYKNKLNKYIFYDML